MIGPSVWGNSRDLGILWAVWPFASAALLLWGLAAAIPIVIHLWSRRRHQDHAWAAMTFLLAALRRNSRRLWFEQWLLLALRVAILLALAAALADPLLDGLASSGLIGDAVPATHVVLVVDVSYSMDYRVGERSSLDRARDAATQWMRRSAQGDGFSLVLLADPPRVAIGEPAFDRNAVLDELRSLRVAPGGADLRGTTSQVARLVADAGRRFPRLARRRVVLFSDVMRNTWEQAAGEESAAAWNKLAESAALTLVDVGAEDASNLAITAIQPSDPVITAGRDTRLEAVVRNFGPRDVVAAAVEFQVEGRPLAVPSVDVPAGGQATAVATARFDVPGDRIVSVSLRPDNLPLDNRRWLSVPVRDQVRALCIEGRLDEASYLALALEPTHREPIGVRVEVAAESALLDRSLRAYDLVCLCNVGRFTADEARALRDYVFAGGRLAVFVGDQVQVENYNAELSGGASGERGDRGAAADAADRRLLPARLEPAAPSGVYPLDPLDYRDPLVAPFRGQERSGLLSTPVWAYLPARVLDAESARVVLALDNGDPLVIRERRGRGEVWLFTTAVSPRSVVRSSDPPLPWTAWATWPSFVPLVQQLLRQAVGGRLELRNATVGQPLAGHFLRTQANDEVTITLPESSADSPPLPQRVATERVDDELRWSFLAATEVGPYVVRRGNEPALDQRFVVNLDTRESDLERLDPTLLPPGLRREAAGPAADAGGADPTATRHLFRYVLSLLIVLLASESTLAWWLGRRGL